MREKRGTSEWPARASMFPELGEGILFSKQEGTAICDVGQHV
jgi:hypothetical protein